MTAPYASNPLVLFDRGPDGEPALFDEPIEIVVAQTPEQALSALARLEQALDAGRWLAGYAAYELGYLLEPALRPLLPKERRGPLLSFGVFDAPRPGQAMLRRAEEEAASARLKAMRPPWPRAAYGGAFAEIIEGIRSGDFYQVNLTHPLELLAEGPALGLYGALAKGQPVPFGALVDLGGGPVLLSRSPELFFEIDEDGAIETRPMKGTAPRGKTPEEDAALKAALAADEKNRAENLMIVDLLRNDLSRISEIGSVEVPDLFRIESYSNVHQMISRIRARLLPGLRLTGILEALFPCGSVTGAPKIAAMEAIRRLEPQPREAYCGAIGWAAPGRGGLPGPMRFNVAIRTLSLYPAETPTGPAWQAVLNVGGGIVADSTAEGEYEESLWKARFATSLLPG